MDDIQGTYLKSECCKADVEHVSKPYVTGVCNISYVMCVRCKQPCDVINK
jgi:hypothetical protein